ncbi:MAG: nucleotidyltransferase domain-containing protein [Nanoarchaeota archaeon]|nr:nucleotidyltransferase domain-containing protein [Nanoarchaeota archaeon]
MKDIKNEIKKIFFLESLRRWHFKDICMETGLSRERVNFGLKQLVKEAIIIRTKPKGKMPYYTANRDTQRFRDEKSMFGLNMLDSSGLFECLNSDEGIKTAILFGSFARGDWNKSSDVDIFIYGKADDFEKGRIESQLKREIEIFGYRKPEEIKRELDHKLIPNIIKGFNIKGSLEPFEVRVNV